MNPGQRPDSYGGDYTGVVRRRRWIVVALTCVGLVGALGYYEVAPKYYSATAVVSVTPTGANHSNQLANSKNTSAINLDTEAQLVTSGTVADAAAHSMHSTQTPAQLATQVSVEVPPNSEVLDIICTTRSATTSAACANAFAQAYLQNRSSSATSWLNGQIDALQDRVNTLQQTAATLRTEISALPKTSSTWFTDQAELSSDKSELNSLNNQITGLQREAADVAGGHILTEAVPPPKAENPKKSLVLPSGFAGGLVLGLLAAFAWDRRDKRIRGAKDAERFLDLPVLLNRPDAFRNLAALASVGSATGKAFTELARRVAAALGEGNHVLLVVGASPGSSGSVTAANLATALARTHSDAVLVCTDPDSAVSPGMLGLGSGPGLAEVMAGTASVGEVARGPATVPGLWVITPGADASGVDYFMQHDKVKDVVSQLRSDVRYVIIEAAQGGTDTYAFAEFADAALVTVEASGTSATEADECVKRLRKLRTPVIGVAVIAHGGRNIKVRPPRQDRPQPVSVRGAGRPDEILATAAAPPNTQDRDGRSTRYSGGYRNSADNDWES